MPKMPKPATRAEVDELTRELASSLADSDASVIQGKTIIQRIQDLLDSALDQNDTIEDEYVRGVADTLAIWRSSSRAEELDRSIERITGKSRERFLSES